MDYPIRLTDGDIVLDVTPLALIYALGACRDRSVDVLRAIVPMALTCHPLVIGLQLGVNYIKLKMAVPVEPMNFEEIRVMVKQRLDDEIRAFLDWKQDAMK